MTYDFEAHCFSFCYKLEDEDYEEDGATWGLICTLNDQYFRLIPSEHLIDYLKEMKEKLQLMIGKEVFVFNRMDSEYKVDIGFYEVEKPLDI